MLYEVITIWGIFTTTEAAGVAAMYAIFLGFCYRTITVKTILDTAYDTALLTGVVSSRWRFVRASSASASFSIKFY